MRRRSPERRAIRVVEAVRSVIPFYGLDVVSTQEVTDLMGFCRLEMVPADLAIPAILGPPVDGRHLCFVQPGLPRGVMRHLALHECAHILMGDADEATRQVFTGPLPEGEDAADLFALLGTVDPIHEEQGAAWLEGQIRELVPLDDRGWQRHRIPRLAKRLPKARKLVRDLHG